MAGKRDGVLGPTIAMAVAFVCILCLFGNLAWTVFAWLRDGAWPTPPTIADAILALGPPANIAAWLEAPTAWFGFHKIVSWLPLWAAVFMTAIGAIVYVANSE